MYKDRIFPLFPQYKPEISFIKPLDFFDQFLQHIAKKNFIGEQTIMQIQPINPHARVLFPDEPALGEPNLATHGIDERTGTSPLEVYHKNAFAVLRFDNRDPQDPTKFKFRGWVVVRYLREDTELSLNNCVELPATHVVALKIERTHTSEGWSFGKSTLPWLQDSEFKYKSHNRENRTYLVERKLKP